MQQGLRPCVQDENAMSALHRPPAVHMKGTGGGGGASDNTAAFKKGTPALSTVRKALGNITNSTAGFGGGGGEGMAPGKTPAGAPRRAPVDVTNSNAAAAPSALKGGQKPALLAVKPAPVLHQQPRTAAAAAALPASRADVLAEGGVERLAGHSWAQLEADRLAREDAEIQQRLASLVNYTPRGLPTFFPFWGATADQPQVLQKDVLPTPPASPMAPRTAGPGCNQGLSVPDLSDLRLPDIDEALEFSGLYDL